MTDGTISPKRIVYSRYWCFRETGRAHKAFLHRNFGAALYWCPRHGLLMSATVGVSDTTTEGNRKQMSERQYQKFSQGLKKRKRGNS